MIKGIPNKKKVSTPLTEHHKIWPFSIQDHNAERAGRHYDLRLGPQGLSWAIRHWPKPGEKSLAKQTSDHSLDYYGFEGRINKGYGKGTVKLKDHGELDLIKSTPDKISFILRDRYLPKRYSLIRTLDKHWLLLNHTPVERLRTEIPRTKDKYKTIKDLQPFINSPSHVLSPKYDGAANVVVLRKNKHPEIFSYRKGKSGLIDHSYKLNFDKYISNVKSNKPTVLWAETLAMANHKPHHVSVTGGMLNANLDKTRYSSTPFKNIVYNIVQHKGKNVSGLPYEQKLSLLKEIVSKNKFLELPELYTDSKSKSKLIKNITQSKHPLTSEGVVVYDLKKSLPLKSKFDTEHTVYIRGVKSGQGKFTKSLGGLEYSHTKDGPIIGIIGGGFTEDQRQEIFNNPKKFIGKQAKIKAHEKLKSGSLRMPIFINFVDQEWPSSS